MQSLKRYIPVILLTLLFILSFFILKPFFISLCLGAILAYVFYPFHQKLSEKIHSPAVSAIAICLFVLLVIITILALLSNSLIQQSYGVFLVGKQTLATGVIEDCSSRVCQNLAAFFSDPNVKSYLHDSLKAVTSSVIKKVSAFFLSLPRFLLNIFVAFFTMYYFLRDGPAFKKTLPSFLNLEKAKFEFILKRLKEVLNGVIYGYLVVALLQGAVGALGFFLFGVSSPLFWGVIMAFFALIPFLGTGIIWVPASLFLIFTGIFNDSTSLIIRGVGLFIYSLIFVASLDNYLKPKLMGEKAKVHPAIMMLGLFGGVFLFGMVGVILGPLLLALTLIFFQVYFQIKADPLGKDWF